MSPCKSAIGYCVSDTIVTKPPIYYHPHLYHYPHHHWHHHAMKASTLLALCEGNPMVSGGFPQTCTKAQWYRALKFILLLAWTNCSTSNWFAGNFACHLTDSCQCEFKHRLVSTLPEFDGNGGIQISRFRRCTVYFMHHTVRSRYNTVNLLLSTHNINPIAHPIGVSLCVQSLVYILVKFTLDFPGNSNKVPEISRVTCLV